MDSSRYAYVFILMAIVAGSIYLLYIDREGGGASAEDVNIDDYDPTVNLELVIRLDRIRKLDFDYGEQPTISMAITVDGYTVEDIGPWAGLDVYPRWRHPTDVSDKKETVSIEMRLFDLSENEVRPGDISSQSGVSSGMVLSLTYSLKNGTWWGDDARGDKSGYGHASGYEDGNFQENDFEVWFSMYQTDGDGDRLTWYEESYIYHTDPLTYEYDVDFDGDGVPSWWEDYWGYDPVCYENHIHLDSDNDGIQNTEEYLMAEYGADPFRQDIFVEVDFMENMFIGTTFLPEYSKESVISAFTKRNIALHIDDGLMGGGGEILPYVRYYEPEQMARFYQTHFLNNGEQEWRIGIFRYAVIAQYARRSANDVAGYSWWPNNQDKFNCFMVAQRVIKNYRLRPEARATAMGSLFMHELGHTLGIFWETHNGCDNITSVYPWLPGWSKYENYRSCMNYRYAWNLIDYSDGSHGPGDFDDWGHINPAFFEQVFFAEQPIILMR